MSNLEEIIRDERKQIAFLRYGKRALRSALKRSGAAVTVIYQA
jgi:hypothetical protein